MTRTPKAVDDHTGGNDGAGPTSPVLLLALALALALAGVGLFVSWYKANRRRPEASGVPGDPTGGPVTPNPAATGARQVAKPTAESTVPSSPDPPEQRSGTPALGYVSVREPDAEDGEQLLVQMAAIDTACCERGLQLDEVVTDLGHLKDNGFERPGLEYALQRLAAGEVSCLVVAELERLSCSPPEVGHIVERLRRRQARLVVVDDGLDTGTSSGREAADKLVSLRAFDRQQGSSRPTGRLHLVPEERATEGGNSSARLATHDVQALKERIQTMRASGMTLQAIADRLNAENLPTLRGGAKWRPSGVQSAAGYRRPGRKASEPGSGAEPDADGSSGAGGGGTRQPASSRGEGATR